MVLLILALGIWASVRERKSLMMWRSKPVFENSSPFASALAQLVGTAGGIYLSLELLFSFLKIPETWWSNSEFIVEPLAVISLAIAIFQPFCVKVILMFRKNR
jgi:protein-S-isoprenylcysteine O-methyltransferase Ste14